MTERHTSLQETATPDNTRKAPEAWVTGDEPMTSAQRASLTTRCAAAHASMDEPLTKAQAARRRRA